MKQLSVTGLPTLIFFNAEGKEIAAQRITGFMENETFLQTLQAAKNANH
jgi:thiol:disulfide interchange protein dsbD